MNRAEPRVAVSEMEDYAVSLLTCVGLEPDRADITAQVFVDAETLGFTTHGLLRLVDNLQWLTDGSTRADGEIRVVTEAAASFLWDADYLPGPYVIARAVKHALRLSEASGIGCGVVAKAQHVACLAAYCLSALDEGRVLILAAGSPGERAVAPAGGREPLLSTNPIAAVFPGSDEAILFDTSTSVLSMGALDAARRTARPLKQAGVLSLDGRATADPSEFRDYSTTPLLPIGGLDHGYKGFALSLLVEALTHGLSGFGRSGHRATGEENVVFVLALDPQRFGGIDRFKCEIDSLLHSVSETPPLDEQEPVRVPGQHALARRKEAWAEGLIVEQKTKADLISWGQRFGIQPPWPDE